jgi:transposase-like protein
VTKRRDRRATLKFLKRAMKRYGRPRSVATDRLRSYRSAMRVIGNAADQECGRWLNTRADNSPPTGPAMPTRFGSPLQRTLAFKRAVMSSFDWTSTTKEAFMLTSAAAEKASGLRLRQPLT